MPYTNTSGAESTNQSPKTGLKGVEITAVIIAATFFAIAIVGYITTFGSVVTDSHEKWGQFGDFMGGFLNPIYALLAFLAVLLSLSEQRKGERRAQIEFQEQKAQISDAAFKEDVYRIVKAIDDDIESILEIKVGDYLTIRNMVYEARRQISIAAKEDPYASFISLCKDPTKDFGVYYARLMSLIEELHLNLILYASSKDSNNPVVDYFGRKNAGMMRMFHDIGGLKPAVINFFEHYHTAN